jgi:hypothetical protein
VTHANLAGRAADLSLFDLSGRKALVKGDRRQSHRHVVVCSGRDAANDQTDTDRLSTWLTRLDRAVPPCVDPAGELQDCC